MEKKIITRQEKKIKMVEYSDKTIYYLNNKDSDRLDDLSEFPIGSITKVFTIISLLILHQNKKINIHDKIGKYLDNKEIKNLKIIDIINHVSGLKNLWDNASNGSSKIKFKSATEVYNHWNNGKLIDKKLKKTYSYSNIGFVVLGVLIEKVTDTKYSEFVKNNILIPLKMNNTGTGDCNITLYDEKHKKLSKYQKWEWTFASSAGEVKSCISDLIKFGKFPSLLSKKTLSLLKQLYIFRKHDKSFVIRHDGVIAGGLTRYKVEFNNKWKIKDIYVSMRTFIG